jgi:hypothetical protein
VTMALRKALQQALQKAQNRAKSHTMQELEVSSLPLAKTVQHSLVIPAYEEAAHSEVLQSALQVLKRNGKRLLAIDLALEPFWKEELAGVFGVLLREEESR